MVKNTHGGSGTKGLARKHQRQHDSRLILPSNELEIIVCVTKMYGNGMCQVNCIDGQDRLVLYAKNLGEEAKEIILLLQVLGYLLVYAILKNLLQEN